MWGFIGQEGLRATRIQDMLVFCNIEGFIGPEAQRAFKVTISREIDCIRLFSYARQLNQGRARVHFILVNTGLLQLISILFLLAVVRVFW